MSATATVLSAAARELRSTLAVRVVVSALDTALLALRDSGYLSTGSDPVSASLRILEDARATLVPLASKPCNGYLATEPRVWDFAPNTRAKMLTYFRELSWTDALAWCREKGIDAPANYGEWVGAIARLESRLGIVPASDVRPVDVISEEERAALADANNDTLAVAASTVSTPAKKTAQQKADDTPNDEVPNRRRVRDVIGDLTGLPLHRALAKEAKERNADGFTNPPINPKQSIEVLRRALEADDERRIERSKGVISRTAPIVEVKTTKKEESKPTAQPSSSAPSSSQPIKVESKGKVHTVRNASTDAIVATIEEITSGSHLAWEVKGWPKGQSILTTEGMGREDGWKRAHAKCVELVTGVKATTPPAQKQPETTTQASKPSASPAPVKPTTPVETTKKIEATAASKPTTPPSIQWTKDTSAKNTYLGSVNGEERIRIVGSKDTDDANVFNWDAFSLATSECVTGIAGEVKNAAKSFTALQQWVAKHLDKFLPPVVEEEVEVSWGEEASQWSADTLALVREVLRLAKAAKASRSMLSRACDNAGVEADTKSIPAMVSALTDALATQHG